MFEKTECKNCKSNYDDHLRQCPVCHQDNDSLFLLDSEKEMFWLSPLKEIAFAAVGYLGLQFIFVIMAMIVTNVSANFIPTADELKAYQSSLEYLMYVDVLSYVWLFFIFGLMLAKDIKPIIKDFAKIKKIINGIGFGFMIVALTVAYNYILLACGVKISDNSNESNLTKIISTYPALSFIAFCLCGPICEEVTYRLGLFSFLHRVNRYLAYAVVMLMFGLIHFNFMSTNITNELLNLPTYIISGLALCYAYEKGGFACSVYAHVTNNVVAFVSTMVSIAK